MINNKNNGGIKMKKMVVLIMIVALFVTVAFAGISCKEEAAEEVSEEAVEETTEEAEAGSKGTLYYLQQDFINTANIYQGTLMEEFGIEAGFEMKLLNAQMVADTQINQMDTAISQNPAAIIVRAVDVATLLGTVEKGRDAGIPMINFDGLITDTYFDFQSVIDVFTMGK